MREAESRLTLASWILLFGRYLKHDWTNEKAFADRRFLGSGARDESACMALLRGNRENGGGRGIGAFARADFSEKREQVKKSLASLRFAIPYLSPYRKDKQGMFSVSRPRDAKGRHRDAAESCGKGH